MDANERIRFKARICRFPEWLDGTLQSLLGIRSSRDLRSHHFAQIEALVPERFASARKPAERLPSAGKTGSRFPSVGKATKPDLAPPEAKPFWFDGFGIGKQLPGFVVRPGETDNDPDWPDLDRRFVAPRPWSRAALTKMRAMASLRREHFPF